jgi:hypothetical protein
MDIEKFIELKEKYKDLEIVIKQRIKEEVFEPIPFFVTSPSNINRKNIERGIALSLDLTKDNYNDLDFIEYLFVIIDWEIYKISWALWLQWMLQWTAVYFIIIFFLKLFHIHFF